MGQGFGVQWGEERASRNFWLVRTERMEQFLVQHRGQWTETPYPSVLASDIILSRRLRYTYVVLHTYKTGVWWPPHPARKGKALMLKPSALWLGGLCSSHPLALITQSFLLFFFSGLEVSRPHQSPESLTPGNKGLKQASMGYSVQLQGLLTTHFICSISLPSISKCTSSLVFLSFLSYLTF